MTDYARVSDEQLVTEWQDSSAARVSDEQLVTEWAPAPSARISDEQLVTEWAPTPSARITGEQLMTEWQDASSARLSSAQQMVEWKPGNVFFVYGGSYLFEEPQRALFGSGQIISRVVGDLGLSQSSVDGGGGTPLSDTAVPSPNQGLAKYTAPDTDPVWGPPLV